jgi:carboxypeptidase C (cathepsin A)
MDITPDWEGRCTLLKPVYTLVEIAELLERKALLEGGGSMADKTDPSFLTTAQLLREIAGLKEWTETLVDGKALVTVEKFAAIDRQLSLVERQRVEQKEDTKTAVDAALQAQKEAVREQTIASERAIAKSEAATTKQLDQQSATFGTAISGVSSNLSDHKDLVSNSLSDLKDRVTGMENIRRGGREMSASMLVIIGLVISVFSIVIAVYLAKN